MFYPRIKQPLDLANMLVEEINFEGGHFNHIVDRNIMLRMKRIAETNKALTRSNDRRTGSRR